MGQILQVNDLHVYYGSIHAVKGVSFEVNEGEVVTLIGANGAGKSTVLNTVSGLLHPKHGSVVFEGKDLKGVPAHKIVEHGLAQVPEGRHVFLQMTVEDNLEMGAYTQPNSTIEAGIADVYERFPRLKERRKQIAGTLSGGEQQMLAMGRALMSKPKLLMLDEPTVGLDPAASSLMYRELSALRDAGCAVVVCTHELALVEPYLDQVLLLATGECRGSGTLEDLRAKAALPALITNVGSGDALADPELAPYVHGTRLAVPEGDVARVVRRLTEAHGVYDFQLRKADLGMIFAHFVLDVPVEEL